MNFKDFYSKQAKEYSKYRPTYPDELFLFLNSIVLNHDTALDCAAGNGQAARGLARYFKNVVAVDASREQTKNAFKCPNVKYLVAKAEDTKVETGSIDLVTIATAIHWVELDLFYNEVKRVLKDDGVFAVWTYSTASKIDPKIDEVINSFSKNILNKHWDVGIKKVWNFDELDFPFEELESPDFEIKREWTYEDYLNYMFTWSSTQNYIQTNNINPVDLLNDNLKKVWGESKKEVIWKIKMKAGKL